MLCKDEIKYTGMKLGWFALIMISCFVLQAQSSSVNERLLSSFPHLDQQLKITPGISRDSLLKSLMHLLSSLPLQSEPQLKAEINQAIGELYFQGGTFDQSLKYLAIAKNIYDQQLPEKSSIRLLSAIGKAYFQRGNYLLAAQNFRDALKHIKSPEPLLEDEIRDCLFQVYNLNPSINLSTSFFLQSFELKKKLGDQAGMLRIAQRLTEIFFEDNQFDNSLQFAQKSIDLAAQLDKSDDVIFSTLEKINIYSRLSKYPEAHALLNQLSPQINPTNLHILSRYETALGNYYSARHQDSLAQVHYKAALSNRPSPLLSQYVYKNQAESYQRIGNYKLALEAFQKYHKEITLTNAANVQSGLINIEENAARKKSKDEIRYLNAENLLKDSLLKNEKRLADALSAKNEIQTRQLSDQHQLSDLMEREVKLQKQKVLDEKNKRYMFILASFIFLLLGGWLYWMYRQQKNKNLIIERQTGEMEMLMKEIHHRVKNNLQIISSLLDMQSMSIQDKTASSAIREGKNRVLSMALIHQNLYHDGNIRSIHVREYIQHLVNSLFDSYQIEKNKIKLNTEISSLQLDVDTVVPLGLIINELISNSLKYAFTHQASGDLSITLKPNGNDTLYFSVRDNGKGFPPGWTPDSKHSFGYQLIKAFSKKLKARLETFNDQGAVVILHISKYKVL